LLTRLFHSRQALKKYVQANNNLSSVTDAAFTTQFNRALAKGSETGVFERPKGKHILIHGSWYNSSISSTRFWLATGASGPVKIAKGKAGSPPATKKAETKKTETKTATKAAPKTAAAKAKKTVS
jgi:histone H1/5